MPTAATPRAAQRAGDLIAAGAGDGLAVVLHGDLGDHRKVALGPHRPDRDHQLIEGRERLQHDHVDSPTRQHRGLLAVQRRAAGGVVADVLE